MVAFIQNLNNRTVQQRLCTKPKELPVESIRYAVAFEEGISEQRSFGDGAEVKTEPVCVLNESPKTHVCDVVWNFRETTYRYAKPKQKKVGTAEELATLRVCVKRQKAFQRICQKSNYRQNEKSDSECSTGEDAENVVLNVIRVGAPLFFLKGKVNIQQISTMIDLGSQSQSLKRGIREKFNSIT